MPAYPQPLADVIRVIDETFMANHDAFRLPGRPRCVDHVGQVLAQGPALRLALVLLADFLPLQIQTHSLSPMGRQTTLQLLRGYHHSEPLQVAPQLVRTPVELSITHLFTSADQRDSLGSPLRLLSE